MDNAKVYCWISIVYPMKKISIVPEKRKELKINKSTLWYQQRKIKGGKPIKVYNKTKVNIE
ncbi:hypothetical protein [Ferroplasma sp.]|jgi:hypothetical protein|uniref:hypothetical protein n=1 Tax=Ferroplasma sp. TaxID=2591003 RepID=UPI002607CD10|nr:hypothetical protein [Ferroplasma sp.]